MTSNPVVVGDLVDRWRELDVQETRVATALLADAWEELLFQIPGIGERVESGALRYGLLRSKVVAVVKAAMLNPEGYVQESIDDWSGRRASSGGGIVFSDADLDALREVRSAGARSVRMGW